MWLAEQGFEKLSGFDVDLKVIEAGREISENTHLPILLWVDNGLLPNTPPAVAYTVILALNWTFLVEGFSLDRFIEGYLPFLEENGVFIFDMIDAVFNHMSDNQYRSSELDKPVEERRPSEYKIRMSEEQVWTVLASYGLKIIQVITEEQRIPKKIYIASRHSLAEIKKNNPKRNAPYNSRSSKVRFILNKVSRQLRRILAPIIKAFYYPKNKRLKSQ